MKLRGSNPDPATGVALTIDQDVVASDCYIPNMMCSDTVIRPLVTAESQGIQQIVLAANKGLPIFWRNSVSTLAQPTNPAAVYFEEGGFYDGAVRIWGKAPGSPAVTVGILGDEHAVSDGSDP